jgi:uncharacterized repeat protein (TIGR03806 family)
VSVKHPRKQISAVALSVALLAASSFAFEACEGNAVPVVGPGSITPTGSVTTYHNDLMRTGQYTAETTLTSSNVSPATFGKLAALPVDGLVYAQPLVAKGVPAPTGGTSHDLVIVATEHDSVYAFDAQTLDQAPVWRRNFIGENDEVPCSNCKTLLTEDTHFPNVYPEVGITATPVIDPATGVVYVIAQSKENGTIHMKLHALSLSTGKELGNSPVEITGSAKGGTYAAGVDSGSIRFRPDMQLSRSGLVLNKGSLYFGMSSFNDAEPCHGWVFSYDATTLQQTGAFITTPNTGLGTTWMAGGAPGVDESGNLYFSTGNGQDPTFTGGPPNDFIHDVIGDSIVKLAPGNVKGLGIGSGTGFSVQDFFTPYNQQALDDADVDLGSGGVLLLPDQQGPHPHVLVQSGKEGTIYVLDRDNLGKINATPGATSNSQIVQELVHALPGGASGGPGNYSTPSYWNGHVYIAGSGDHLRSYPLVNGVLDAAHMTQTREVIASRGSTLSISTDGGDDAILWAVDPSAYQYAWNGQTQVTTIVRNGPAILMAYDANDLTAPIYRSDILPSADSAGYAVKFAVPTVAGGHVYVGTQTEVSVYGLISTRSVPVQPADAPPPSKLSLTGFFTNLSTLTPAAGMVEYDVNSPLWSDGAAKRRWILLPSGQKITFDPLQAWNFPVGTRMIKHFELPLGNGTTARVETRVLTKNASGWNGVTYQWNDDQSDAVLLVDRATKNYQITDASAPGGMRTQTWNFPSQTDCMSCHTSVAGYALGVQTRQLNRDFAYAGGSENQLAHWNRSGMFTADVGAPSQYDAYASISDATASLDKRTRSYLAVNCAHCHQPNGPTAVDIDFRYDTPIAQMNLVGVQPTKGNLGVPGAYRIDAGHKDTSVVWLRIGTTAMGRMPPIGTSVVDTAAVQNVGSWIDGLSSSPGASRVPPLWSPQSVKSQ